MCHRLQRFHAPDLPLAGVKTRRNRVPPAYEVPFANATVADGNMEMTLPELQTALMSQRCRLSAFAAPPNMKHSATTIAALIRFRFTIPPRSHVSDATPT